mmetsp:Transcript_13446/g.23882  ORF Transcript_13446/g.23882 Transcript_13446/m.23882 type:complete len:106 (+) Transcript_13446:65-382(+)
MKSTSEKQQHKIINVNDFQIVAKTKLDKDLYEYVASGSDDEQTLAENQQAFKRIFLRPRMMRDVSRLDTSVALFGEKFDLPVIACPAGVSNKTAPYRNNKLKLNW